MLTPADADLARRDPGIPGLTTVLDPDAFLAALERAGPGSSASRAEIAYVKYSPQVFCRVAYRVEVAGVEVELDVRACRPEDLGSWLKKSGEVRVPGPFPSGRMVLDDFAVLVTVFPNDPKLPQLRHLTDVDSRTHLLRRLLPGRPELWEAEIRCLRYWPERRYSAELSGGDGARALLKVYTPKGYARSKRNAQLFHSSPPLRVARLLGFCDDHRLLAFEWLSGVRMAELCAGPHIEWKAVAETGAALAALHAQLPGGLEGWSREQETAYLFKLSREIGFLCPDLSARAEKLVWRLSSRLTGAPPGSMPLHGDFNDGQVLIDGREVAIVDLDSAYRGDAADDLGSLLAQAETRELRGKLPPGCAATVKDALLSGYRRSTRRPPPERVGLYTASGLLRRARFAFRARKADWQKTIEASLLRAEDILDTTD